MPSYQYRCRQCGDSFEVRRPMSESNAPASCPCGHDDTVKLLTTVAVGGRSGGAMGGRSGAAERVPAGGGGCCGGGCCG
jgi:putative FmdB family regulatory protein